MVSHSVLSRMFTNNYRGILKEIFIALLMGAIDFLKNLETLELISEAMYFNIDSQ